MTEGTCRFYLPAWPLPGDGLSPLTYAVYASMCMHGVRFVRPGRSRR